MTPDEIIAACISAAELMNKKDIPETGREVHISRHCIQGDVNEVARVVAGIKVVIV